MLFQHYHLTIERHCIFLFSKYSPQKLFTLSQEVLFPLNSDIDQGASDIKDYDTEEHGH